MDYVTNDAILVLKCIFQTIWSLFNTWNVPGFGVTPAEFILFLAFAGMSLRFLFRMVGITPDLSAFGPAPKETPDMLNVPRLNAPGDNRGVYGYGPGWGWTHRN